MPELLHYPYDLVQTDLLKIVRNMAVQGFKPDFVLGIARGGLIPATMISHYLETPLITAKVSLRDERNSEMEGLDRVVELLKDGKSILMVDDICDSGDTLKLIWDTMSAMLPDNKTDFNQVDRNLRTAVLWNNPAQDKFHPDFSAQEIDRNEDDSWIVFPWENWWEL
jgi:xanthine phosphoribosyltransferase